MIDAQDGDNELGRLWAELPPGERSFRPPSSRVVLPVKPWLPSFGFPEDISCYEYSVASQPPLRCGVGRSFLGLWRSVRVIPIVCTRYLVPDMCRISVGAFRVFSA